MNIQINPTNPTSPTTPTPPSFLGKKLKSCIAAAVAGFALIFGLIFFFLNSNLGDVARDQLAAIKAGDIDRAYNKYTSGEYKQHISLETFRAAIQSAPAFSKNKESHFNSFSISNDTGRMSGTLVAEDGTVLPVEYEFVKENGKWKIFNINPGKIPSTDAYGEAATSTLE